MSTEEYRKSDSSPQAKGSVSAFSMKFISIGLVVCAIIFLVWWGIYSMVYRGPVELARGLRQETTQAGSDFIDLARNIGRDIAKVLQFTPQVTVNGVTIVEANRPILELATVERKSQVRYKWEHSWMGSKKMLELEALVRVKAGFDLKEPFLISIDSHNATVTATMPPSKVLSVEMISYKVLEDKNGWWNRVTADDREQALQALMRQARQSVGKSDILAEADRSMRERIEEIMDRNGKKMPFIFRSYPENP